MSISIIYTCPWSGMSVAQELGADGGIVGYLILAEDGSVISTGLSLHRAFTELQALASEIYLEEYPEENLGQISRPSM